MQQIQLVTKELTPSSRVLEDLLHQAPLEYFTVGWLMSNLHRRSFGVVILFLGLLATVPIGSTVPGLMLAAVAFQMIAGSCEVVFPQFIASRSLPTRYLFCIGRRGLPVLKILEQAVHPRWPLAFEAAKRLVGVMVLLLTVVLLLTPVPLSNIAPAIVIALIALTYTQEDGLLLCFALLAAVVLIGAASAAIWGAIISATFISRVW
jgi:hypothetical protein